MYIYIYVYIYMYIYIARERDSCIYWSYSFEFFWSSLDWSCSVGFPHQKDAIRRISFFKTTWMSWTHNTSKASWDFELGIKFRSCLLNRVSGATDRTMPPNRNRRDDQTSAAQAQHRKNNTAFLTTDWGAHCNNEVTLVLPQKVHWYQEGHRQPFLICAARGGKAWFSWTCCSWVSCAVQDKFSCFILVHVHPFVHQLFIDILPWFIHVHPFSLCPSPGGPGRPCGGPFV